MTNPVPFEYFFVPRQRAAQPRAASASSRPRACSATLLQRLQEEYPWLAEDDVRRLMEKTKKLTSGTDAGGDTAARGLSAEDYTEMAYEDVMQELAAKQEEWDIVADDVSADFHCHLAGGAWTKRFKGVAVDSVWMKSRAHTFLLRAVSLAQGQGVPHQCTRRVGGEHDGERMVSTRTPLLPDLA